MKKTIRITFICIGVLTLSSTGSLCSPCFAEVKVYLRNGRNLTGEVDIATTDKLLWIRSTVPGVVLRSALEWDKITHVRHAGRILSAIESRKQLADLKSAQPKGFFTDLAHKNRLRNANSVRPANRLGSRRLGRGALRSLQIEAVVANWDRDAETDGIRVRVSPLDAAGQIIPVRGWLDLQLIGHAQQASTQNRFRRRSAFPVLGRWNIRVRESDFKSAGAVYQVPFEQFHPESDLSIAPYALFHARLNVASQGSFEATEPNVHLLPFSQIRDELQGRTGRRLFPHEVTR